MNLHEDLITQKGQNLPGILCFSRQCPAWLVIFPINFVTRSFFEKPLKGFMRYGIEGIWIIYRPSCAFPSKDKNKE